MLGLTGWSFVYNVEQQRGKDAALWKAILLSAPSAAFTDEVHKTRLFDNMFWISYVSLTSGVISNNFLVRIMWFTDDNEHYTTREL